MASTGRLSLVCVFTTTTRDRLHSVWSRQRVPESILRHSKRQARHGPTTCHGVTVSRGVTVCHGAAWCVVCSVRRTMSRHETACALVTSSCRLYPELAPGLSSFTVHVHCSLSSFTVHCSLFTVHCPCSLEAHRRTAGPIMTDRAGIWRMPFPHQLSTNRGFC